MKFAHACLKFIAQQLRETELPDGSLAGGEAGVVLFEALHARWRGQTLGRRVLQRMERAAALAVETPQLGFLNGLPGVAWVAQVTGAVRVSRPLQDFCVEVDGLVLRSVAPEQEGWAYEHSTGLAGFGLYADSRGTRSASRQTLERISAHLKTFLRSAPRLRGLPLGPPAWLTPSMKEEFADLALDLGVAHGVMGLIGLLALLVRREVDRHRNARTLIQLVNAVLALRSESGILPMGLSVDGRALGVQPPVWCLGSSGAAGVLQHAGEVLARPAWQTAARLMAQRISGTSAVGDAFLCHGQAGRSLMLDRFGRPEAAAEREALCVAFARVKAPPAGFLEGMAGLGLVLLEGLGAEGVDFGRALMLAPWQRPQASKRELKRASAVVRHRPKP